MSEEKPIFTPHPVVLLTGAGFTSNFGGFLAGQFWETIINQPKISASALDGIRGKFLDKEYGLNFEAIYTHYRSRPPSEFPVLLEALNNVFQEMDALLRFNIPTPNNTHVNENLLWEWLHRFAPTKRKHTGFIFTLNQDLFFERFNDNFHLPAIPDELQPSVVGRTMRIEGHQVPPPAHGQAVVKSLRSGDCLNLIKLHGSCNWLRPDGSGHLMIVGTDKVKQKEGEPLIAQHYDLFTDVLGKGNIQLWIVGYSFRDDALNRVIANAVKTYNTKICVISPQTPVDFFKALDAQQDYGPQIRLGIAGYISNTFSGGIFPAPQNHKSRPLQEMERLMDAHIAAS